LITVVLNTVVLNTVVLNTVALNGRAYSKISFFCFLVFESLIFFPVFVLCFKFGLWRTSLRSIVCVSNLCSYVKVKL
jgi:hypothetical protein